MSNENFQIIRESIDAARAAALSSINAAHAADIMLRKQIAQNLQDRIRETSQGRVVVRGSGTLIGGCDDCQLGSGFDEKRAKMGKEVTLRQIEKKYKGKILCQKDAKKVKKIIKESKCALYQKKRKLPKGLKGYQAWINKYKKDNGATHKQAQAAWKAMKNGPEYGPMGAPADYVDLDYGPERMPEGYEQEPAEPPAYQSSRGRVERQNRPQPADIVGDLPDDALAALQGNDVLPEYQDEEGLGALFGQGVKKKKKGGACGRNQKTLNSGLAGFQKRLAAYKRKHPKVPHKQAQKAVKAGKK